MRGKHLSHSFSKISPGFSGGRCVTAELVADRNTYWLSNFDASGVGAWMLSGPTKMQAPKSMTHLPPVWAFDSRLGFTWFVLSPYGIGGCLVRQDSFVGN